MGGTSWRQGKTHRRTYQKGLIMDITGLGSVFDFGTKVIDRLFPDPDKKQEAKLKLFELQQNGELAQLAAETDLLKGQLAINAEEAKNSSLFVSGWRPALAWGCLLVVLVNSLMQIAIHVYGSIIPPLVDVDTMDMIKELLFVLVGARSIDKFNGTKK